MMCPSLCKDVNDENEDVAMYYLVQKEGVWGKGGSVSLGSLVWFASLVSIVPTHEVACNSNPASTLSQTIIHVRSLARWEKMEMYV